MSDSVSTSMAVSLEELPENAWPARTVFLDTSGTAISEAQLVAEVLAVQRATWNEGVRRSLERLQSQALPSPITLANIVARLVKYLRAEGQPELQSAPPYFFEALYFDAESAPVSDGDRLWVRENISTLRQKYGDEW